MARSPIKEPTDTYHLWARVSQGKATTSHFYLRASVKLHTFPEASGSCRNFRLAPSLAKGRRTPLKNARSPSHAACSFATLQTLISAGFIFLVRREKELKELFQASPLSDQDSVDSRGKPGRQTSLQRPSNVGRLQIYWNSRKRGGACRLFSRQPRQSPSLLLTGSHLFSSDPRTGHLFPAHA